MMYEFGSSWMNGYGFGTGAGISLGLLMLWSLFWKGLALWHAARKRQPWWYVALLIFNTAGILEIIYLFAVAKVKKEELFR